MKKKIYFKIIQTTEGFELHSSVKCLFGWADNYVRSDKDEEELISWAKLQGWERKPKKTPKNPTTGFF